MATGKRSDPFRGFKFRVSIDGIQRAGFREVSGLDAATDPIDYREGDDKTLTIHKLPGLKKFSNLTLKRGITDDHDLWKWRKQVMDGKIKDCRKNGSIILMDDEGNDVAQGEIGALVIKGDSICAGYWNRHEKTKATFEGHWFRTGDKYYQDEDGYFWYAGRADDLFKVNGRWLSPAEVESALIAHPAVQEAAVISREDDAGLPKPMAYVVVNSDTVSRTELAVELQDWVAQRIGAYKRPRWVEFLPEIPKTATGKLQRFKLREGPA